MVAGRDSSHVLLVLKFVTQRLSAALCAAAVPPAVAAAALTQHSDLPDFQIAAKLFGFYRQKLNWRRTLLHRDMKFFALKPFCTMLSVSWGAAQLRGCFFPLFKLQFLSISVPSPWLCNIGAARWSFLFQRLSLGQILPLPSLLLPPLPVMMVKGVGM